MNTAWCVAAAAPGSGGVTCSCRGWLWLPAELQRGNLQLAHMRGRNATPMVSSERGGPLTTLRLLFCDVPSTAKSRSSARQVRHADAAVGTLHAQVEGDRLTQLHLAAVQRGLTCAACSQCRYSSRSSSHHRNRRRHITAARPRWARLPWRCRYSSSNFRRSNAPGSSGTRCSACRRSAGSRDCGSSACRQPS